MGETVAVTGSCGGAACRETLTEEAPTIMPGLLRSYQRRDDDASGKTITDAYVPLDAEKSISRHEAPSHIFVPGKDCGCGNAA
jgi:hypothetical protein